MAVRTILPTLLPSVHKKALSRFTTGEGTNYENFNLSEYLLFLENIELGSIDAAHMVVAHIVLLLKDYNIVLALLQEATRQIEGLLGTHLPVTAQIDTIDKDDTLAPLFHIEEGVAGAGYIKLTLVDYGQPLGIAVVASSQHGSLAHGQTIHFPLALDRVVVDGDGGAQSP